MEIVDEKEALTNLIREVEEDLNTFSKLGNVGNVTKEHLEVFANSVAERAEKAEEMLCLMPQEMPEEERSAITKVISKARRKTGSFLRAMAIMPHAVDAGSSKESGRRKLQPLALPIFSGNIREWRTWWPSFQTAVENMVPMDRLQYLLSALEGAPLELIKGYSLIPENYETIIASLDARYNNVDLLAQAYQQDLEAIPVSGRTWLEQQTTLDTIRRIVTNLRSIGVAVDEGNARALVIQRFPESTIVAAFYESMFIQMLRGLADAESLANSIDSLRLPLELFLDAVGRAILKLQFIAQAKSGMTTVPDDQSDNVVTLMVRNKALKREGGGGSGNTGGDGSDNGGGPSTNKKRRKFGSEKRTDTRPAVNGCVFCNKSNHRTIECRTYATLTQRRQRLSELRLCYACLKSNHRVSECHNRHTCAFCHSGIHHLSICAKDIRRRNGIKPTVRKPARSETRTKEDRDGGKRSGTDESVAVSAREVTLVLSNFSGNKQTVLFLATDLLIGKFRLTPPPETVVSMLPTGFKYADGDIFSERQRTIEILLGSDVYYDFVHINGNRRLDNGIVLLKSFFGWIPAGMGNPQIESASAVTAAAITQRNSKQPLKEEDISADRELSRQLEKLWSLEALGIKSCELEDRTDAIIRTFQDTRRIENGRYVVRWPRRKENINIPTNYRMCVARLKVTLERNTREVLQMCHELFLEQERSGIIERAPHPTRYVTHYLPHHPVWKDNKLRVVYDASAKTKSGISLNDVLHAGPSLQKDIVGLMIGFRLRPIAVVADIEKGFHQVGLDEADRDMVRFLWVTDPFKPFDTSSLVVYRFKRVPFGIISSPFLLNMVLDELFASALQLADGREARYYALGQKSFYVDNLVVSVDNTVDAVGICDVLTRKLREVGFNLRDWASNAREFTNSLTENAAVNSDDPISVLGLNWNRGLDTLSLRFQESVLKDKVTKRIALATYAEVYDPWGALAPCVLGLKLFVQECWAIGLSWDTALPVKLETKFRRLVTERDAIRAVNFPRRLWSTTNDGCVYSLHIFCDASKKAYGCVHYLVKTNIRTGQSESSLLFSKVRLAPRKYRPVDQLTEKPSKITSRREVLRGEYTHSDSGERSIPQLELLGATLGARSSQYILTQLKERSITVKGTYLWTDATTVLQWLHTPTVLPLFVENRIKEIKGRLNLTVRYVPTRSNPADLLTRGRTAAELQEERIWWHGPDWLTCYQLWPEPPHTAPEFITGTTLITTLVTGLSARRPYAKKVKEQIKGPSLLSDRIESHYSIWSTYVRLFSIIRRKVFKHRIAHLSATEEYKRAEIALLRAIQLKYFPVEIAQLEHHVQPKTPLDLFLDSDNLIRCRGRLLNANLPFDTIHPILLPRNSRLTDVLLFSLHNSHGHIEAAHLLATLRERFWIMKGRSKANSIVRRCVVCRRVRGGTYATGPMHPLPLVRVADVAPFVHTGVDCFGPYYVRYSASEQRVNYQKMYGVIFTCLVTRAVHLEVVEDLSGDQFLLALVRFVSRRGSPRFILSDNGTNFKFVQPLVSSTVKLHDFRLENYLAENKIEWSFIPTMSPWYGGIYERLVGVVKQSLHKSLGHYIAGYSELITAFCRVESVVNSRPLTYVSSEDTLQALTPSHFLNLRKGMTENDLILDLTALPQDTETLLQGYQKTTALVEMFRNTFHSLYLTALRQTHEPYHRSKRGSASFKAQPGAVVLLQEPYAPRSRWPMGVIESLDKRKAQARIKVVNLAHSKRIETAINETFPTKVVTRPVRRLVPFEVPFSQTEREDSMSQPVMTETADSLSSDMTVSVDKYTPPLRLRKVSDTTWQVLSG